jgi:ATP-dependent Clp protease ATP-binding subunit ClpC
VDDDLPGLLERARSGETDDFEELLAFLRRRGLDAGRLLEYIRSDEAILRRAAVLLARDGAGMEILDALRELVGDLDDEVRLALAETVEDPSWWPFDSVVAELLQDDHAEVRRLAVRAAARRPSLELAMVARLSHDESWRVRQEIAIVLRNGTPRAVLPVLLTALAEDADSDVQRESALSAENLLGKLGGYPADLIRPRVALLSAARDRVRMHAALCPLLAAWLEERVTTDVDVDALKSFGTVLTLEAEAGRLPRAYEVEEAIEALLKVFMGEAPRAAVVVGDAGAGKTALIYELVHRLRHHPGGSWQVLRISPAEFLAGTVYLGEWETKVRNLVQAVRHPRRVLLYVPNLEELATMGMSSKSDANVANALAPHIERGEIAILGESSLESFRKGLGAVRSLRRLFHAVQLPPADAEETRNVLEAVAVEAGVEVSASVLDRLMELADFYASGTVEPGRSVGLLRRLLGTLGKRGEPIGERDILSTISNSTGIPVDFLDDNVPLNRAEVRSFFESRVMGQPEAVDAVVDLVTLVKAGLSDPHKPFGVMLFVGPTGVGKTELARSLAELLFGDPARMIRLDMSEYATYEAYERLIGVGAAPGLLTATVRERPFSVLLFDEIEKAHLNIFDLCLQIFDAGRLTDAQGRTADFRRTIIILTSNIGSRVAQEAPVGFGRGVPPPDPNVTLRELSRSFRPEFLNRLDRIVTFRPLSQETAEKIARRELAHVVERTGILRRRLVVDPDPGVLPLLLREGYSPAYGARPLKRTVERLVLLPVARVIAAGETPPGSILRLVARRGRVEVEVEPPESAELVSPTSVPAARAVPVSERAARLQTRIDQLRDAAAPLTARKSELLTRAAAPGLWDNRTAAQALYDEVYRIDGILAALDNLDRAVRDQVEAAGRARTSERDLSRIDERLETLESQAQHVAFLVSCRNPRDLGDAFLTLSLVTRHGTSLDSVATLARMYVNLARRHRFEVEVLDDRREGSPAENTIVLLVNGAGAFALLSGEAGLHQISRGKSDPRGDGRRAVDREVVRVEVLPVPLEESAVPEAIHVEVRPLGEVAGRLLVRPKLEVHLRHEPTLTTLRAWTDRPRSEAVERLKLLLRARVAAAESATATEGRSPIVRRYSLGPAPLVRDVRSGRSTGRVDQVLDGNLDLFLAPANTPSVQG